MNRPNPMWNSHSEYSGREENDAVSRDVNHKTTRPFFATVLTLWLIQTLLLASGALLLMFCDAGWVDLSEQQRVVRDFMANPVEMVIAEVFGMLCILLGISGLRDTHDSSLDAVWAGYTPLFVGVCLTLLFIGGLFPPWWLFR
jgi:hypothetical protein